VRPKANVYDAQANTFADSRNQSYQVYSRGGLGLKTGPGNMPMTFQPTGPARAKL